MRGIKTLLLKRAPAVPSLTLVPRLLERDEQVAKSTFPAFRQLLQDQGKMPGWSDLLTVGEKIPFPVAESVLDLCLETGQPRGLVHLLVRIAPGVQFSTPKSAAALRLVREKGDSTDLRQVRRLLQQLMALPSEATAESSIAKPTLNVGVDDINEAVSLCLDRQEIDEAMKWFMTMQDALKLIPLQSTCNLLIPALIRTRNWDYLYYIFSEMQLLGFPFSQDAFGMLLEGYQNQAPPRWQYLRRGYQSLLQMSPQSPEDLALLFSNSDRVFSILSDAKQFAEVLEIWGDLMSVSGPLLSTSQAILNRGRVLQCVGIAAIHLESRDILSSLFRDSFSISVEGQTDVDDMLATCLRSDSINHPHFGCLRGIALGWLWAHGDPERAENLQHSTSKDATSASATETLVVLAACLERFPSDSLDRVTKALSDTFAALDDGDYVLFLTKDLVEKCIELFGRTQDIEATVQMLLRCEKQNLDISETAVTMASQTVLRSGEYSLVLQILESYLAKLDIRSANGKTPRSSASVFSPALQALAQMGELDMMMTLLLKEMPNRRCPPNTLLFVIAINACHQHGRFEEGVRLFELAIEEPKNKIQIGWEDRNDLSALVSSALTCCAKGRLGSKALDICAWIDEKHPHFYQGANSELRNLELVARSMANRESISLLPTFMGIVSNGDRAVHLTRQLFVYCLAAARSAENQDVYQAILKKASTDSEFQSDKDLIKESQDLAQRWS